MRPLTASLVVTGIQHELNSVNAANYVCHILDHNWNNVAEGGVQYGKSLERLRELKEKIMILADGNYIV